MSKLKSLEDFLLKELKSLYSTKKQIVKELPEMIKTTLSTELKNILQNHLDNTENQVTQLEEISKNLAKPLLSIKHITMQSLIEEVKEDNCTKS